MNTNKITDTNENTCAVCGCAHEELFELEIDGETKLVCADCAEAEGFVRCADCGEWVPEDEAHSASHGYICEACYEDSYFTCEKCGEVHELDEAVRVNPDTRFEEWWCCDCADSYAERCIDCGEYVTSDRIDLSGDNGVVCDRCNRWGAWHVCYDCNTLVTDDDATYSEAEGEWYCDSCAGNHSAGGRLHDYGYKPDPEIKSRRGEDKSELTFGVELEVDRGNSASKLCEELEELGQPIYMKHDGSLGSEGVEIVTHPCTLAYHTYEMRWGAIANTCKANDFRSHDTNTCGLHIHIGCEQMGETYAERRRVAGNLVLLAFGLWDKLVVFSRRDEDRLNHWAARPKVDDYADIDAANDAALTCAALETESDGRYQGVNLCANDGETVEFRIFRGTLKRDTVIAAIQLVNNLTMYAMTHTPTECINASLSSVLGMEEHKELRAYCIEKGLV